MSRGISMRCICWAWCASIARSLADAVGYLTRAARERPDDAQVNYHLGTALLGLKLYAPGGSGAAARGRAAARRCWRAQQSRQCARRQRTPRRGDRVLSAGAGDATPAHVPARFNLGRSLAAAGPAGRGGAELSRGAGACAADDRSGPAGRCTRQPRRRRWSGWGATTRRSPRAARSPRMRPQRGGVEREPGPAAARPLRRGLAQIRRPLGRRRS